MNRRAAVGKSTAPMLLEKNAHLGYLVHPDGRCCVVGSHEDLVAAEPVLDERQVRLQPRAILKSEMHNADGENIEPASTLEA